MEAIEATALLEEADILLMGTPAEERTGISDRTAAALEYIAEARRIANTDPNTTRATAIVMSLGMAAQLLHS